MKFVFPEEILAIAAKLKRDGFKVYLVGGCVRDLLMEAAPPQGGEPRPARREPKDWDITTDAKPEEIQKIFPESVYENSFGTVLVKLKPRTNADYTQNNADTFPRESASSQRKSAGNGSKLTFPCVSLVRGKDAPRGKRYGPFTASSQTREALRIIRRIFPFSTHSNFREQTVGTPPPPPLLRGEGEGGVIRGKRPCFDYQIGLCPGTCIGAISRSEYQKNIRHIILFLEGKKARVIKNLERGMKTASRALDFEKAERLKRQLFALQHIQDIALINDSTHYSLLTTNSFRIEGYDISNISGDSAVGSMVVFVNGKPDKNEYRKFRIKTVAGANDVAMLTEVLMRRFQNAWRLPRLILVDGGLPQARAAARTVKLFRHRIPVIGLAKGPERKRNDIIGAIPKETDLRTLIRVRDEAHRFAVSYHKKLRGAKFLT